MSVWLKDLHSNWPSWLAVALTCFISGMGFSGSSGFRVH